MWKGERSEIMSPQTAAERAVAAVGCGYDLASDIRLSQVKLRRIVDLDSGGEELHDVVIPGGVVVPGIPKSIRSDKGERIRFHSDVLSFHQMSEQFNQDLSLSGKVPSGLFNAMFDFRGSWQKEASTTKSLCFDGWCITLYTIELEKSHIVLIDQIMEDVPSSWDPFALAGFIEKYGTHVIVGVKMGGKDVIYVKQQKESALQQSSVQKLLKRISDDSFSEVMAGNFMAGSDESSQKSKDNRLYDQRIKCEAANSIPSSTVSHLKKDNVVIIRVRRGGINMNQSHSQWLATIPQSPNVISMNFVPITSLLCGIRGGGFLGHAINLYLRYKPPIEELHQFLDFQLPRQWVPAYGEIPVGPQKKKAALPFLQFTLMGPKLHVNTVQVDCGNHPVTGIRLFLEGKKNDCLAIHLQHLSSLPDNLQFSDETECGTDDISFDRAYYEPVSWSLCSHICTAPVQYSGVRMDDSAASIVTKAWLEVRDIGMRKVLFLRLGYSNIVSMKIRRSEWDGPATVSRRSGSFSGLFSVRFSAMKLAEPRPKIEINSAIFPNGPPVPIRVPKMSKFVDTTEVIRGPDDLPGYWAVTGAKLCVEGGKIYLKVKYSLLMAMTEYEL